MQERESYPPGVPCWLDTMQPDPDAAKDFYGGLFGWEFDNRAPQGSPDPYYVAQIRGRDVAAIGGPSEAGSSPIWNPYTAVDSVDGTGFASVLHTVPVSVTPQCAVRRTCHCTR